MKIKHIAAPAVLALALVGCTPDEPQIVEEPATTAAKSAADTGAEIGTTTPEPSAEEATPEPSEETTPAEETTEEPAEEEASGQGTFGDTFGWDGGVEATVTLGEEFTPSEWASGGEGFDHHVTINISVTNNSDEPLDLVMAMGNVQSGTGEGDQVFDTDQGFEGTPSTTLLPGRTVEWKEGYGVMDPEDIVFEFAPSWDHDAAFWTN